MSDKPTTASPAAPAGTATAETATAETATAETATAPATVQCSRCSRQTEAMAKPPMPGKTGEEIRRSVCEDCWAEWQRMEVMVINELRLNFMDPEAQVTLDRHMREFLVLPARDA